MRRRWWNRWCWPPSTAFWAASEQAASAPPFPPPLCGGGSGFGVPINLLTNCYFYDSFTICKSVSRTHQAPCCRRLPREARAARQTHAVGIVRKKCRVILILSSTSRRVGERERDYSTVTLFARLRGWSTSVPLRTATW